MVASIAVCVDGSAQAESAFATAVDLARRLKARLLILSVATSEVSSYLSGPSPPSQESQQLHFDLVNSCLKRAETAGVTDVGFDVLQGTPADAILDHLERDPVDMVVVGARGLSRAQRMMLGSVSLALSVHAPCSVLVVRPPPPEKKRAGSRAGSRARRGLDERRGAPRRKPRPRRRR